MLIIRFLSKYIILILLLVVILSSIVLCELVIENDTVKGSLWNDWVKGLVSINSSDVVVYGGFYQSLFIARINIIEETVYWAKAIGYGGVLGDYPEFRDAVIEGDYVYVTGFVNIGGGKQLCVAKFSILDGSMAWGFYLSGVSDTAGLGISVADDYVFVVGYTSDYSADGVDGFAIGVGKNNGTVLKAYRVDLKLLFDGSREYIVDLALYGNTSYLVGMTDAYDPNSYDIVVANITRVGYNETAEQMFILGNTGVYEVAGIGDWCVSGGSIAVDPLGYVWVIGEYRDFNNRMRTLVFRLTSNLSTILFSKRLLPTTNPDNEFYPTSITIAPYRTIAYISGFGIHSLYSTRFGYILRVSSNGTLDYTYSIHDTEWVNNISLYKSSIYGDNGGYRIHVVGNVYDLVDTSNIVMDSNIPPYLWDSYECTIVDKTYEVIKLEVYGILTTNLSNPINIDLDNPTTNTHNIYLASIMDQSPPPAINEPIYIVLVVVFIIVIFYVIENYRCKML